MDKWLTDESIKIKKKMMDQKFKSLSIEERENLKKKQIREFLKDKNEKETKTVKSEDFYSQIIKFKEWLNNRHYLKGDIEKIEVWIRNLNELINLEHEKEQSTDKSELKESFKMIPPNFLEDKYRLILNKKLNATKLDNSDRYYLKKMKVLIQKKMNEAEYFQILKRILEG